jgi:hypothetical protein
MTKRKLEYKPLLLTTTMRNPERLKNFLSVLIEYEGQILNDKIIEKIAKILIKKGLYQPLKVSQAIKGKWNNGNDLTDKEVEKIFLDNPQSHKEAGFKKGWASRFDTWFKIAKELGFVWYAPNEKIEFSKSGQMLLDKEKGENEILVFANAFAKYQRNNPFRRVLNKNNPLLLLIKTIKLLNDNSKNGGVGISRNEIPLLLCWQNGNAESLYNEIIKLRKKYSNSISNEVILDLCYKLLNETKRNDSSLLADYPDDFIRKMRLTGLISIRGGGRFIDINKNEIKAIDYIVGKYAKTADFDDEREFFNYMSEIDISLLSKISIYKSAKQTSKVELKKWRDYYDWSIIKEELLNLSNKKSSKDEILRVIEQPLRLEFLISIAILKQLKDVIVKPNFISDDEGLPISFASGGKPDIECFENDGMVLVEVTLLTGTQQHIRESFSVHRHLEEYMKSAPKTYSIFISPKTFIDTERYFKFIKNDGFDVRTSDINCFVSALEKYKTLNNVSLNIQ